VKLENIEKVIDPITYEPKLTFTGSFSLEALICYPTVLLDNEFRRMVGGEFILQLEEGLKKLNANLKEIV
jgi:hypothetical protein